MATVYHFEWGKSCGLTKYLSEGKENIGQCPIPLLSTSQVFSEHGLFRCMETLQHLICLKVVWRFSEAGDPK